MPVLSSKLPDYTGEYGVGVIDLESPLTTPRRIGAYTLQETDRPAFEINTVLFSLYYPAEKGVKGRLSKHPWQPRPLSLHAEGYARFAKINNWLVNNIFKFGLWSLVGSNDIPAEVDVGISGASKAQSIENTGSDSDNDQSLLPHFPVIVFSHGMASGRTSYTQYCGELASRGYVVAAVEHRDGSGPGSVVMHANGTSEKVFHISEHNLIPQPDIADLKKVQLDMRQAELEETVRVLKELNQGQGRAVYERNLRREGTLLDQWKGRLDFDHVVVGGHSYGATLALQALKEAPSSTLPFKGGVILDPGKQSGPLNDDIDVPVAIVHSQSWSAKHTVFHGRPHFDVVKDLAKKLLHKDKSAWFVTAKGTTHPSVTDAPLLQPMLLSWTTGATIDVKDGVQQYVKITDEFMQFVVTGDRQDILKQSASHPEYNAETKKCSFTGLEKYWQIHVAP
ncbi:hypothetical protein AMS68_003515 [Peltaster fructicola]|uniref:Putative phospholipase n=1 Tax=Peltaster fructicola TaxID=286661 RepID=A0A6H0XTR0_9PEZI|nr:hypothetical protein AMS68_003515 [Peltaster fructicola]